MRLSTAREVTHVEIVNGSSPNQPIHQAELGLTCDRTVLAALPRVLLMLAVKHGLRPEELCAAGGFHPSDVADPDRQVPYGWLLTIANLVESHLPAIDGPLEVVRFAAIDHFGYLGQAIKHASTPSDALGTLIRYAGLLDSAFLTAPLRMESNLSTVLLSVSSGDASSHARTLTLLAGVLGVVRAVGGEAIAPREVRLAANMCDLTRNARAYFRCPVGFGGLESAIVFDRASLEVAAIHADAGAARCFGAYADALVAQLEQPFVTRVSLAIASLLPRGDLSQRRISRYLALSQRSLQRKLHQHGLKYSRLVESTRKAFALRALLDADRSIADVASELGYRDASSFSRVFKRWTGLYPHTYRTRQRARLTRV